MNLNVLGQDTIEEYFLKRELVRIAENKSWTKRFGFPIQGEAGLLLRNQGRQIDSAREMGIYFWDDIALNTVYQFVIEFCTANPSVQVCRDTNELNLITGNSLSVEMIPHEFREITHDDVGVIPRIADLENKQNRQSIISAMGNVSHILTLISPGLDYPHPPGKPAILCWVGAKKN